MCVYICVCIYIHTYIDIYVCLCVCILTYILFSQVGLEIVRQHSAEVGPLLKAANNGRKCADGVKPESMRGAAQVRL